ncbi:MAG: cytochrome c oxidase subunit 3 [Planctomycetaceae bacterium]|nr:cytochrome c oxidase subunit 3 [Planctomycetaceae bacterium]MCA9043197.1 cytochrome c oxidase subunit 3 [Planctomycetaceae bacterium]MCB9953588.1 cytochrome c oxidase subunit 3 [Planctomycetaceae bacterium]
MVQQNAPERFVQGLSRQTLHFFVVAATALALAGAIARGLMSVFPQRAATVELQFSNVFWVTSLLLVFGSLSLETALHYVRVEKQAPFRRWLIVGLTFGVLFMGVQTFAIWSMFPPNRTAEDASMESTAFALTIAALHAIHFFVAVLFVSWVTARTWSNRYDHEYHWGVRFCAWFWHALGVIWMVILLLFCIVSR